MAEPTNTTPTQEPTDPQTQNQPNSTKPTNQKPTKPQDPKNPTDPNKKPTGRTFTREELSDKMSKEKDKWSAQEQDDIKKAVDEALKTQKMTPEQKQKYEENKKVQSTLDSLTKKLVAVNKRSLEADAGELLQDAGLSSELRSFVVSGIQGTDDSQKDDTKLIKSNVKSLKKVFDAAVEKEVNSRIPAHKPTSGQHTNPQGGMSEDDIFKIKDVGKRLAAIAQNQNLFK